MPSFGVPAHGLWLILAVQVGCVSGSVAVSSQPARDSAQVTLRRGLVAALQARGDSAVAILRRIDERDLDQRDAALRACVLERLGARRLPTLGVEDPLVRGVLATYQEYWLRSIRRESPGSENDQWLLHALNTELRRGGAGAAADLDSVEAILAPLLTARGYHSLLGVTSPLRELMLWRAERAERFAVPLPQGEQAVTVVFMDDFVSLGWAAFATCDRLHTGGWTKPDRLFAVASAYDTTSEAFRVSYLAHEGQHFWDSMHLPADTPQDVLEYRAKLVELAVGQATVYDLLTQFTDNSGSDPAVPHSFANGRVIRDLGARVFPDAPGVQPWREVPVERINAAAAALLREDIARRSPR